VLDLTKITLTLNLFFSSLFVTKLYSAFSASYLDNFALSFTTFKATMATYPRLQNKVVLITGASAGFGEAAARQFAASGSNLILGARRLERLQALQKELKTLYPHVNVHVGPMDVTDAKSVKLFIAELPDKFKEIDILVNNAGLALGTSTTWDNVAENVDIVIDTNVKGPLNLIREVVPGMIARNRGHVINVSSIAAYNHYKGGSIYCASKAALDAITTILRKETHTTKIRVTSICPGLAETEFSVVRFGGDKEKAKLPYNGIIPLSADDVADTILYAASRPDHVQISDLTILATHQANAEFIHRETQAKI